MFYPLTTSAGVLGQQSSISSAAAESAARDVQSDIELFKHDLDRLLMITEALWTLLKQEHGYTDDVLTGLIENIDQRKVRVDGTTVKDPPLICADCGRPNLAKRAFCIYCGKPLQGNPFAR